MMNSTVLKKQVKPVDHLQTYKELFDKTSFHLLNVLLTCAYVGTSG